MGEISECAINRLLSFIISPRNDLTVARREPPR